MKRSTPLRSDPAKVRAWQDRSRKNLDRSTSMPRATSPLPKVNRERRKRRREEAEVYGPYHVHVSTLPCLLAEDDAECLGKVTGHHLKTVGAGGKDAANEVALCAKHHREVHASREKFEDRHRFDLDLEAAAVWMAYCCEHEADWILQTEPEEE